MSGSGGKAEFLERFLGHDLVEQVIQLFPTHGFQTLPRLVARRSVFSCQQPWQHISLSFHPRLVEDYHRYLLPHIDEYAIVDGLVFIRSLRQAEFLEGLRRDNLPG